MTRALDQYDVQFVVPTDQLVLLAVVAGLVVFEGPVSWSVRAAH
jgi:hypothetical protein